eukprot:s5033_g2.t1
MPFHGGLQLLLDLQGAFDCVDRQSMIDHLPNLDIPAELCALIAAWHSQTHYFVGSETVTAVKVGRGVRQGCKLAPSLWLSWIHRLLTLLIPRTGFTWIQQHVTIFADDIHAGGCFCNFAEFEQLLCNLGHLLDVVEELHLQIQYAKSHILLASAGHKASKLLKGLIMREPHALFLLRRPSGKLSKFPMRGEAIYLGVVVSYHNFEDRTVGHRMRAAWTAFNRLRSWLKSRQMGLKHRLRLWSSCILPVMTYGIHSTGITVKGMRQFQQVAFTMLRVIVGDHAYCTHHTHQHVLIHFDLEHPLLMLHRSGQSLWRTLQSRVPRLDPCDIVFQVDWSHLADQQHLIYNFAQSMMQAPAALTSTLAVEAPPRLKCDWCSFETTSVPNLRRHCTSVHNAPIFRVFDANFAQFAYKGTPQCSHCFASFPSWRQFILHLERNVCQAPQHRRAADHRLAPGPRSPRMTPEQFKVVQTESFGADLIPLVRDQNWAAIHQNEPLCAFLKHNCPACGVWNSRTQEVHTHLKQKHPLHLSGVFEKASQLSRLNCGTSPCTFCHTDFRRTHSCTVMTHLAFVWLNSLSQADRQEVSLTCSVCQQYCATSPALLRHVKEAHGLQLCIYNAARDALPHSTACAHCGAIFETSEGLRQHIADARCPNFDAGASSISRDVHTSWHELLSSGDFQSLYQNSSLRLEYTLRCQFCSSRYARSTDLATHLSEAHPDLWMSSQGVLRMLLSTVFHQFGCCCNPATSQRGLTHICNALRQTAMAMQHSNVELLVPTQFDAVLLRDKFFHLPANPAVPLLEHSLASRNFAAL